MPNELSNPLNSAERSELRCLVKRIKTNSETVLADLATIHTKKLYREHGSFQTFVEKELEISKTRAYQLLKEVEVRANLTPLLSDAASTIVDVLPANEAQSRPLTKLEPEKQAEAWKTAVEKAKEEGKPVTAAIVEEVVEELLEPQETDACPNCGGTERDEDGDCKKCREPAGGSAKPSGGKRHKAPTPADVAKKQVGIWADTIGRWLRTSPTIDEYRDQWPGEKGDRVVKAATELHEALKLWQKAIK